MNDEHWSAVYDSARAVRVHALGPFGLTDRQARFLVTVMAHSGSFLERQYCAFAGIARGQNSREFVARLVARGYPAVRDMSDGDDGVEVARQVSRVRVRAPAGSANWCARHEHRTTR